MARAPIRVGCSGWQYGHWRGSFYPRELPAERWLEHYANRFDTVELNGSFYRLPAAEAFARWRERLPPGFAMAVKASRYLTHLRRLRNPDEPLKRLWSRADRLEDRLGPMLYQLPPRWNRNLDRLRSFAERLPRDRRQAMEFRDPTWHHPDVYRLLDEYGLALCLHDMPEARSPREPVGPFIYVRLHGAGRRYGGRYPSQALAAWATRLLGWADAGLPAFVYFNNDVAGHAPRDADRLREMLARRV